MSKKMKAEIYRLENTVQFLRSELWFLKESLEKLKEESSNPDLLQRIAERHKGGTLNGHILTAETFGDLVERFLKVEEAMWGEDNA